MDTPALSESDLDALASEVDVQLTALRAGSFLESTTRTLKSDDTPEILAAPEQQAVIEKATGEKFETFWQKYLRHARRDLCLPGGMLHDQWKKWRDLESKAAVRVSYGWLAAMGIPAASLGPVAVAATVFLLNAALKIGIETICEGCAEEEKARVQAEKEAAKAAKTPTKSGKP